MPERWELIPPPQTRKRTKDSQVSYSNLTGWVNAWYGIKNRKAASDKYTVEENHLKGLPPTYITACTNLKVLREATEIIKENRPPRGQRGGHFTTQILMEINNQIDRIRRKTL